MVDSVAGTAISTLLRAQTAGVSAGIVGLKSNQQATQALINQLQQGVDQGKALIRQSAANLVAQNNAPLPRGSLIDISV